MGVGWDHKSLTPERWLSQKAADPRFKGLNFAAVFSDAADFLSSARCTRTYKSPSAFLLTQLKMAAERINTARTPETTYPSLREQG